MAVNAYREILGLKLVSLAYLGNKLAAILDAKSAPGALDTTAFNPSAKSISIISGS